MVLAQFQRTVANFCTCQMCTVDNVTELRGDQTFQKANAPLLRWCLAVGTVVDLLYAP